MKNKVDRYDKILGCILGAAIGDAMGSATETKSTRQIEKQYGGRVTEFKTPLEDVLARGRKAGQITDAFSIPYVLMEYILNANGKVSRKLGEEALIEWGKSEWFGPFAGMTTRNAINRLNENQNMGTWAFAGHLGNKLFKGHYYALSSNGAAVKAYPMGLLYDDSKESIENTIELTMASHDDPLSISGACAISSAVREGIFGKSNVYDMVQSALSGSKEGELLARDRKDICIYPGPSVTKRLEMAIELVLKENRNDLSYMDELRDLIGCGPAISETVPTAIGLFMAHQGEMMQAIYDAVNIGDETSAIASIVGALCGALNGTKGIDLKYLELLEDVNNINIKSQAMRIYNYINNK